MGEGLRTPVYSTTRQLNEELLVHQGVGLYDYRSKFLVFQAIAQKKDLWNQPFLNHP